MTSQLPVCLLFHALHTVNFAGAHSGLYLAIAVTSAGKKWINGKR